MKKLAHFVLDEKFIDSMIEVHDNLFTDVYHEYIFIKHDKNYQFQFIRSTNRIIILFQNEVIDYLVNNNFNGVFLHCLSSIPCYLIPQIPKSITIFWKAWGYDIYSRPYRKPLVNIKLYYPYTLQLYKKLNPDDITYKSSFSRLLDFVKIKFNKFISGKENRAYNNELLYYNAINRVDYFAGILTTEYDLVKSNPYFRAKPFNHPYTSLSRLNRNSNEYVCEKRGQNILLGNSASITNNHLDLILVLSKLKINGRKIIVPLNYGGDVNYVKTVIDAGESAWNNSVFYPITNYLDRVSYFNLISSCGYYVFLFERQQALGNISYALRTGVKLFLSETSVFYHYLKNEGFIVYSIQKELNEKELNSLLSMEDALHNYTMMEKWVTKEGMIKDFEYISNLL